jgi:hypothetical protein
MEMEMGIERRLMVSEQNQVIVTTKEASMMMSTACGGPDTARLAGINHTTTTSKLRVF